MNWSTPNDCKKFNNGSGNSTADYSFRWAARCAVPGGTSQQNASFWNPPPPAQPYNSNYYTISSGTITNTQNLDNALLELKPTATITLYDNRTTPPTALSATVMPLQYTYSCKQQDVNYCQTREVFDYALDTNTNPVDGIKHGYGWVRWRKYTNPNCTPNSCPGTAAVWNQVQVTLHDHLVNGQVPIDFPCF